MTETAVTIVVSISY